jgi:hypothetical protein
MIAVGGIPGMGHEELELQCSAPGQLVFEGLEGPVKKPRIGRGQVDEIGVVRPGYPDRMCLLGFTERLCKPFIHHGLCPTVRLFREQLKAN